MNKNELRSSGEPRSGGFANGASEPMSFSLKRYDSTHINGLTKIYKKYCLKKFIKGLDK